MNLKRTLQMKKGSRNNGAVALMAWKIVGNLVGVLIIATIAAMIPEMIRYLKLKSM